MVGARVIKTGLAVSISILIAKGLHLHTYQFAGIVAVLSVQPSLYRSLRNGVQQTASAVLGAVLGAIGLWISGASFLTMGLTAFVLMVFHVQVKWTNSLLISVVIAINTMGTTGLGFWESAWNQISLVLIGTIVGTLINLIHKPIHQERAEVILTQAEGMLRALLHYVYLDMQKKQITPYPLLKDQIDEMRKFIKKGKEISRFVHEDRRFRKTPCKNTSSIFQTFESMLERIHDMTKVLANIEFIEDEITFSKKSLNLLAGMQERIMQGKTVNLKRLQSVLDNKRSRMWKDSDDSEGFYNFYGHLKEYLKELEHFLAANTGLIERQLSYTSIDRPGLIAEISTILVKHGFNIQDVSIRVNGEFAKTTMKLSCQSEVVDEEMVKAIRNVDHVLSVEFIHA